MYYRTGRMWEWTMALVFLGFAGLVSCIDAAAQNPAGLTPSPPMNGPQDQNSDHHFATLDGNVTLVIHRISRIC